MRLTLMTLEEPTEADHMNKLNQIKRILKEAKLPTDLFAYSDDLGEHGAFHTEHQLVYDAVQKALAKKK
jgi:hypothetical protein